MFTAGRIQRSQNDKGISVATKPRQILAITEDHLGYDPNEIHGGHVGTMASVVEDLKVLAEKVGTDANEALDS